MKKHKAIFWGLMLLLLGITPVYGADTLCRLMHQQQDALIIGKIQRQQGTGYQIRVERVISGKVVGKTLEISSKIQYSLIEIQPRVGDYCVASLDRKLSGYQSKWGIFKIAAMGRKVKLVKSGLTDELQADLTAMEWYINSNGRDTEFYFDGTNGVKAYLRKPDGASLLIYPETVRNTSQTNNGLKN